MRKYGFLLIICLMTGGSLMAEQMSADQWLEYNQSVTAMFEELSAGVNSGEELPIKCATPILNELIVSQPKGVDSKILYVGREDTMSYTYGTAHFLIHYTDNGPNRVYQYDTQTIEPGVPDYIVNAARICDSVWNHTVGDLGFTQPASDGYYNGGGDGRLDIYIIDFPAYGATVNDSTLPTLPPTTTTYMFLENDYEGFPGYESNRLNALRVAMAHEFFHSVQFAIDASEFSGDYPDYNPAWIEMSATYMEEEHYPEIDDYINYLMFFFDVPQWSVRTGTTLSSPIINYWRNLHMYGSVVFPLYLSEQFGAGIIKDIWDGCGDEAGPNWPSATDDAIVAASGNTSDLGNEFQEFALWNLFTKHRARAGYYPDADIFDTVNLTARVLTYPATITPIDSVQPDNLGSNYIILENLPSGDTSLIIAFDPDPSESWGITTVGMYNNVSLPVTIEHIKFDTVTSMISIPDVSQYDKMALIVTVLTGDGVQLDYSLTVTPAGPNEGGVVQPNGGEVLYSGHSYNITWYFPDGGAMVDIDFSSNNGDTWTDVAETENDLVYEWTIPDIASDACLIRIADMDAGGMVDTSDAVFSIIAASNAVFDPFPNPAWPDKPGHEAIYFKATYTEGVAQDVSDMTVTIMTIAGEKVRELVGTPQGGLLIAEWDFKNVDGRNVAAGPYLAVIKFQDETTVKKFVVLR